MLFVLPAIGVLNDALDDALALAKLAGAAVKVFAAGRTAIEHLRRRDVVDCAAHIPGGIGVEVGECVTAYLLRDALSAKEVVLGIGACAPLHFQFLVQEPP